MTSARHLHSEGFFTAVAKGHHSNVVVVVIGQEGSIDFSKEFVAIYLNSECLMTTLVNASDQARKSGATLWELHPIEGGVVM